MVKSELTGETQRPKFSKPVKVLVVVASYYKEISDDLISGATEELRKCGADFDVITVPGALELPTAIGMASRLCEYDAYVALGCVVRGETTHYDTVCNDSSTGLLMLGLQGLSIGNGILTVENIAQAKERSDPNKLNKGAAAALAALSLLSLSFSWQDTRKNIGFKSSASN
jgi:6,7-dimethyl-8-ribityllumazine synthase